MRTRTTAALAISVLCIPMASAPLPSQTTGQELAFEVVSIKLNTSDSNNSTFGCHGTDYRGVNSPFPLGRCVAEHTPLQFIIAEAYGVAAEQMFKPFAGGPGWLMTDYYDIHVKAEQPATEAELNQMLQTMLKDRFKLKIHRDEKEALSFALVVTKNGAKLQSASVREESKLLMQPREPMRATSTTMAALAKHLAVMLQAPVEDKTNLKGAFDFVLDVNEDPSASVSLFTAIEEQLGLKLEATKGRTQSSIVIDHVERPTLN